MTILRGNRIKAVGLAISLVSISLDCFCLGASAEGETKSRAANLSRAEIMVERLAKGIVLDVSPPTAHSPVKVSYEASQLDAIRAAGFRSVRIYVVAKRDPATYQAMIEDALARGLAVVISMWGDGEWAAKPKEGLAEFVRVWDRYASFYKNHPQELVFDLWNEPAGLLVQNGRPVGIEDGKTAMEYLNAVIPVIRKTNPTRILGVGGPGLNGCAELEQFVTPEHLTYKLADGSGFVEDDRLIGLFHMYHPHAFTHWTQSLDALPRWKEEVREQLSHPVAWSKRWRKPVLLSEWGAWAPPSHPVEDFTTYLRFVVDECARQNIGWIYYSFGFNNQWAFNIYSSETGWNPDALKVLTGIPSRSFIRLKEIDGRIWLVRPDGRPFFAHGVTHVAYGHNGEDVNAIARACKELGFNAYGYGCPDHLKSDLPYVDDANGLVLMAFYRGKNVQFVDIFDPKEQARIEREVKKLCERNRDNPNLIGYFWTDLAAWPLENQTGTNWVEFIRNLPAGSPGQAAWRKFLVTWQGDDAHARDLAFLTIIAREYFRVCGEANRNYDPNHIVFGDRFSFQTIVPEVIKEMLPYVDAIAIQPHFNAGFPKRDFDRVHELTGRPIILCDFAIAFREEGKQVFGWRLVENAEIAGREYSRYMQEAFATPYILGSFWCNPVTQLKPTFYPPGFVKQGLFKEGLEPRPELHQAIRELNQWLEQNTPKH